MSNRGRRPVYDNDADREKAASEARTKSRARFKNISIDADLVGMLNTTADGLSEQFGFRPTLSQTLRHLIARNQR